MESVISTIKDTSNLLRAVRSTMDGIDIRGIENQDKFVGCANAILTSAQTLEKIAQELKAQAPTILEDGATAKELAGQGAENG